MKRRREVVRFIIAGAINTGLTYALYLILLRYVSYLAAYTAAYVLGILLAYLLNAMFVFRQEIRLGSFLRFPAVYVVQYFLGSLLLWILVDMFALDARVSLLAVIAVTLPVTYLLSRRIILPASQRGL